MATLYHQLWINATPATVYNALATAEGLGAWWAPHTTTETAAGQVLAHSPGEAHGEVQMRVVEQIPNQLVVWEIISHHPAQSPASSWTGTHIAFEISERESPGQWIGLGEEPRTLTVLDFRHTGWDEHSPFLGFCNFAWGETLLMLQKHCEGR